MKSLTKIAAAVVLAGAFAAPAFALSTAQFEAAYFVGPACSLTAVDPSATGCEGIFAGNNLGESSPGAVLTNEYISNRWGVTAGGVTFNNPDDTVGGDDAITFDLRGVYSGSLVVAIKQADFFALYYYEDADPFSSVTYTGYDCQGGKCAADVSHFTVYGVNAIPEPETYALMLAGLAAVGFMARRRRQA